MKAKKNMRTSIIIFLITCCLFPAVYAFSQTTRSWATYYGGPSGEEANCVAVDGSGNVYLTGYTFSTTAISTAGSHQPAFGGGIVAKDAFLVKFNSAGVRQWATYYGGTGSEVGYSIAVDNVSGNVYLAGWTSSATSISTAGSHQPAFGGANDAFLVQFNSVGVRQWATYYGGTAIDKAYSVAVDGSGNVYLTGETESAASISTVGSHQPAFGGISDAFLVKFNSAGVQQWATYYGGTGGEQGYSVAVDNISGNVYLAGYTFSTSTISTVGSHQPALGGGADAFLVQFNSAGVRQWATYYGGTADENINASSVAVDPSGNVYLAGETSSPTAISTAGSHQPALGSAGVPDTYLVKFDATGTRQWATYYGGALPEEMSVGNGIRTDASGVYLCGDTYSTTAISTPSGFQTNKVGEENQFLAVFDAAGSRLCATYYGQVHEETGTIAVDNSANVYLAGYTASTTTSGIATAGSHQPTLGGNPDAYLVKFTACVVATPLSLLISPTNPLCNSQCTGTATANATGGTPPYAYSWGGGQTTQSISNLCAGIYSVVVTDFATTTTTATVTITQPSAITLSTSVIPCVNGLLNGAATVTPAGGTAPYTYAWATTPIQTNDTATGLASGTYSVVVTDNNNCSDSAQAVIDVCALNSNLSDSLLIPNVFTPNGDGNNDLFYFPNAGYKTLHCEIYNRWGTKIYEWDDVKGRWDGRTTTGKLSVDGVYYYIMTAEKNSGEEYKTNGFVQLLRNK